MKQHLLKNIYAAIVALFIGMMALPTTVQAQSIAKQALKSSSGEMPITGNKIKTASAKASVSFPLLEDFESGEIPDGWTLIDADNNGRNWQVLSNEKYDWVRPKSGKHVVCSFSDYHNEDLNPDNYLISPKISGATQLIYWFAMNPKYPDDRYQVLASTTGKDISDFTIVLKDEKPTGLKPIEEGVNQSEWIKRTLQLPVGTKYIAFRHYDSNKSGEGNYILLDDIMVDDKIINYALYIAGKKVTSANCDDLSEIDGVEGKVSYDHSTKTLTLDNATIKTSDNAPILISQAMNIKVVGKCNVDAGDRTAISSTEPFRIYSERNELDDQCLDVVSGDCAIFMNHTDLIIENCTVNTKGTGSGGVGIAGNYSEDKSTLTIKGDCTRVTAEGKVGSICSIVKLTLDGCAVTQPKGAAFDASLQGVALNGELVTSKVVIEKTPSAIEYVTTDALAAKQGIYTISGVKLNGEAKDLPKGIYIVNGKKFVKK